MRIKFLEDYTVKAAGGESYTGGKQYTLSDRTAQHFINKGIAEVAKAEKPVSEKSASQKPDDFEPKTTEPVQSEKKSASASRRGRPLRGKTLSRSGDGEKPETDSLSQSTTTTD